MIYAKIDFSDPNLDYGDVENENNAMFSDLVSQQKHCCSSARMKDILSDASNLMRATDIATKVSDEPRYKSYVQATYYTLYNYASQ